MVLSRGTDMSSMVILCMVLIQGVLGTFFPPVRNPPPIPAQSVRTLENGPRGIFLQENLPRDFSPPFVKEGLFSSEEKTEDQRWYLQEKQSNEADPDQGSAESFERYYQSGEPAIGPVATPIPDDVYLSQPSSVPKLNPNEPVNSDLWFLTRRPYNQYIPDRWFPVQLPSERIVEIVNEDPGPPLATDTVKSVVAPVLPEVPVKQQFTANTLANIIQQIWVRSREPLGSRAIGVPPTIVEVPSVKQIVEIPAENVERVVREEIIKEESDTPLPSPDPKTVTLIPKKPFTLPPPPPPALKGYDSTLKNGFPVPVNVIPNPKVVIGENGLFQRVRHVWVPTSPRTGKFISFPVPTSLVPGKPIVNAGTSLDSAPVTVSDTWVLKQAGPIPSFEQRKPLFPPRIQSIKTIFQDPPVIKVDAPPNPPIIVQDDLPKSPVIEKSEDSKPPVDIWPARNDFASAKGIGEVVAEIVSEPIPAPPKPDEIAITTSLLPPKILVNPKPPIPLPIPPPTVRIINGKPCPVPILPPVPPKYLLSPRSPTIIAIPKQPATQKRPLARIVRVNRHPSGSYYLLNNRIKPSFFTYPPNALPPKFVRLVQSNQIPLPPKAIPIPQSKQFPAPVPAKQVLFPFQASRTAAPVPPPKSSRIIYPATQPMKYTYPWNPKNSPVPGKAVYLSQSGPQKATPNPDSSSEVPSESSSEAKAEKLTENPEKEGKNPDEKEKESGSEETEGSKGETSKDESIEVAESEVLAERIEPHAIALPHPDQAHNPEIPDAGGSVPNEHDRVSEDLTDESSAKSDLNLTSNHVTNSDEEAHPGLEGSNEDMTTVFVRD